jgi:hypothetical protein
VIVAATRANWATLRFIARRVMKKAIISATKKVEYVSNVMHLVVKQVRLFIVEHAQIGLILPQSSG